MADIALFIHSTAMGPFMWKPYVPTLPEGLPALTPVNRGYAPDDLLPLGQAFSVHDEVRHLLRQLPADTTGVHLLGHSYGGFAALTLAQALAEAGEVAVRSLWLYEPVLFGAMRPIVDDLPVDAAQEVRELFESAGGLLDETEAGEDRWLARFIDYWNQPGSWAAMPDKVKALTRMVGAKMYREVRSVSTEPQPFAQYRFEADVSMTLVHGAVTRPPAREMVRQLAAVNPHVEVLALEGLGHMGLVSAPQLVQAALQAHWARVMPGVQAQGASARAG